MTLHHGCVRPGDIAAIWDRLLPWVTKACGASHGRYEPPHIRRYAEDGIWHLWIVSKDGAIVFVGGVEAIVYPTGLKAIHWHFGVGDGRHEWQNFMPSVEAWAKENGCHLKQGVFRRGWKRIFRDWRHTHDFLEGVI